jgi:hypothetical protein
MKQHKDGLLIGFLVGAHLILSLWAAQSLSPVWDEIGYPHSGVVQLRTGSLKYFPDHPYLARMFSGMPFLLTDIKTNPTTDPINDGFNFTYRQDESPRKILLLGRLSAIVFSVLLLVLLFFWARRTWGSEGAILTAVAYLATPIFMSRASLALVEMPMLFFIAASFYCRESKPRLSAVSMGLALLCKFAAAPAAAALFLYELRCKRIKRATIWAGYVVITVFVGYLPWRDGWDAFWAAVDTAFWFNKTMPYYFHGTYLKNAPGVLSLVAMAIKAPILTVGLGVGGAVYAWKRSVGRAVLEPLVALVVVYMLISAIMSAPVSTIQLSPIYLAVVMAVGALGSLIRTASWKKTAVMGLLVLSLIDVYSVYPNHVAYFNWLVGGSNNGPNWLGDSDQDWGQSLPALGSFIKKNPQAAIFLSYSGAGRPEAHGVTYVDFFSPSLTSRTHIDEPLFRLNEERPVFFVLSSKVRQAYGDAFQEITTKRRPKYFLGQSFYVYDISKDERFYNWMSAVYSATNRPEKAAWCAARAAMLSLPTNTTLNK